MGWCMMLAKITINWQPIIGTMLLCFGVGLGVWQLGRLWLNRKRSNTQPSARNSDKPAPKGFATHALLICETAPAATSAIREQYLLGALTEAQVLRAECERLAKRPQPKESGFAAAASKAKRKPVGK